MSISLEDRLRALEDRIEIQDLISVLTLASDLDEPTDPAQFYTDDAVIDYKSVFDTETSLPVAQHRERSRSFMPGFEARQHQTTNFDIKVDGDTAKARSQVRGIHLLDGKLWVAHGTYFHRLVRTYDGWRITNQRAQLSYQDGAELVDEARNRVASRAAAT